MSVEYGIYTEKISEEALSSLIEAIKTEFPSARCGDDGSLWIPSINPKWIDFSIERSDKGLFIVNNLNGKDTEKLFPIIGSTLSKLGVNYLIEEI